MFSFLNAFKNVLDAAAPKEYYSEAVTNSGVGLIVVVCVLAGALLLSAIILVGVALYQIKKDRTDRK